MVTFAQAQERAERWVNADVPSHRHREVLVREFDLGFVAWAEDGEKSPSPDGSRTRLVIARDSGDMTLWPGLAVGEVIRRYEEEYASTDAAQVPPAPPSADLEATSFLLTPPEWLQEAAERRETGEVPAAAPSSGASAWDAADTSSSGGGLRAQQPPATVFAPPIGAHGEAEGDTSPPEDGVGARTAILRESAVAERAAGTSAPAPAAGGYVPTQLVSAGEVAALTPAGPGVPPLPGPPPAAPTAPTAPPAGSAPGVPGPPPPPGAPGTPSVPVGRGPEGGVHQAATMPGQSVPPAAGPPPAAYGFPQGPPGMPPPAAPAYGYPQQPPPMPPAPTGQPTVGPGYMAVLRYRAPDGSEQQVIRRSAPGTPHPEWQIMHELRGMNVPPEQVLELHTELESCALPGGYCARMIKESWPQVRVSHTAAYGRDHATRQQGMRHLVEHQGELHQVADGPARPAPNRVPLPPQHQIQPVPPVPPDGVGYELAQSFGPQGVFRFDQRAVSRQGVPDVVGQTLVWAGVPVDVGPFFWGQAQPGRPVPTLAELAQERGVQPGPDAGSYLVMGNDFGRQMCVQYGTAHIVAVPLEADVSGQPAQPQFANSGLPEFLRCLALLGRMWPLRYGLTQEQAGRWTVDFQMQLAALDPAALSSPENWWSVLLEQMWDGLF